MSEVDLSALRMGPPPAPRAPRRPLRWGLLAISSLALGVAATFLVPLLTPVRGVSTAPVRLVGAAAASRSHVAEAAGWIEPDPFPVVVRPLVSGVLREIRVLEGADLKANETIVAVLESAEHLAARDRAVAAAATAEAEESRARTELEVARSLLEQKADLRVEAARARGERDLHREQHHAAVASLAAVEAALEARRADLAALRRLGETGGASPVALRRAEAAAREAEATVEARRRDALAAKAEWDKDEIVAGIAEETLGDPRRLEGEVARAGAELRKAALGAEAARTERAIAERELAWCEVRAPLDGVVLKLLAAPGAVAGPEGEGILAMYDPTRLQARIDVPLAAVGSVNPGQEAEVRSDVTGTKVFRGTVIRVQRESDVLKNTLQVKVRIEAPDPLLRPETLCRARFLVSGAAPSAVPVALFAVPRRALRGDAVYVIDPRGGGRARRIGVEPVGGEGEEAVVRGDLSPTQRVILDAVEEGDRVREEGR